MAIPEEYLREGKIRGIVGIRNLKSDEMYLYPSEDAVSSYGKERFRLDLGMHQSKELQEAYSTLGLELFMFEIDMEADEGSDLSALLEERKRYWTEKGRRLYS